MKAYGVHIAIYVYVCVCVGVQSACKYSDHAKSQFEFE